MNARLSRVAVVGGGYMGGGIAQTFAINRVDCVLADVSRDLAEKSVARLRTEAERYESEGLFPPGAYQQVRDHLFPATSLEEAVGAADYIAEAVPEDATLKHEILSRISRSARPEAVIASNTSAIPIADLARSVQGAQRFLGAHWMNPAYFVPCVEVIPTDETDEQVVRNVMELLREVGKSPTRVSDAPGFIANRLQYALFKECTRLVEEGIAEPAQIDEVVSNSFGFRLPFFGPFAIADIAGLDVYAGAFATMEKAFGERMSTPGSLLHEISEGRLGTKSGGGFYHLEESKVSEVTKYRDRSYAQLNALKNDLGDLQLRPRG